MMMMINIYRWSLYWLMNSHLTIFLFFLDYEISNIINHIYVYIRTHKNSVISDLFVLFALNIDSFLNGKKIYVWVILPILKNNFKLKYNNKTW